MGIGKVLLVGAEENPSLPIITSLSKKGLEVHVASHKRICLGFFSRYAYKRFLYPSPYEDENGFINRLLDYIKNEHFDVTLVVGDHPTDLLSKNKELFIQYTALPLVDLRRYVKCRDKTKTMKIAQKLGIPIPKTYYPQDVPVQELAEIVGYPVVLKPNTSDGARGISFPKDKEELLRLYGRTVACFGPCHLQEYIPQTGMQYKAELLLDYTSDVKAACVYNKLRYYPPSGGSSTLNSTVDRKDMIDTASTILKEMEWYGMGDCDFIEDPRDGIPKLMEINPRFTRSIKICVTAGVDFPYLMYKMAIGETVPLTFNYQTGVFLRYFPADCLWFLRAKERFRIKPSFFWFLGKNLSDEIFSLNDPGPSLAYFLSKVSSKLNRKERTHHFGGDRTG